MAAMSQTAFANRPTRVIQNNGVDTLERQKIRLTVVNGQSPGLSRVLDVERVRIGAGPGNDLTLSDPTVSSAHFELQAGPQGFTIRDLGSTNGTFVSGVRVVQAFLPEQAELRAGDVAIRFLAEKDI